jgi:hypothetical protein
MNKEPPISNELYEGLTRPRIKTGPEDGDDPDVLPRGTQQVCKFLMSME